MLSYKVMIYKALNLNKVVKMTRIVFTLVE